MPLRDHFHSPLYNKRSWDELLGQWPAMIVMQLMSKLPAQYIASPQIHLGGRSKKMLERFSTSRLVDHPGCILEKVEPQLEVGKLLPTLPLWLGATAGVLLDLEASDEETCRVLRM